MSEKSGMDFRSKLVHVDGAVLKSKKEDKWANEVIENGPGADFEKKAKKF